ncbi:hypothetical protein [Peribacillus simplex]|uniref:hypothetical protein n=1 Tax=Peribacillus simplex TaxID=1478 RepID=UPI003D2880BC
MEMQTSEREKFAKEFYERLTERNTKGIPPGESSELSLKQVEGSSNLEIVYKKGTKDNGIISVKASDRKLDILDYAPLIAERKANGESLHGLYNYDLKYTSDRLNNAKDLLIENGVSSNAAEQFAREQYKEMGSLTVEKYNKLEKNKNSYLNGKENESLDKNKQVRMAKMHAFRGIER